jgi:transcription antitermination factor NusG
MSRDTLDLGSWCILRMASADTLRLAKSLTDAGLQVWTPVERKVARSRLDRSRIHREAALMPSYVFGRVEHVNELLRLAMMQTRREHARFSVFRYQGGIPLIADGQLDALRDEEGRAARVFDKWKRRGMKGPTLTPGTEVKMPDGPFAGISGIVEGTEGQYTLIDIAVFGKPTQIKVASILLLPEGAEECAKAA